MASIGLPSDDWEGDTCGNFLTFVLPAVSGCNLKCSFCLISQRKEITVRELHPSDFVRFIHEIAAIEPVVGIALQGYEPLLPATLPYTTAILAAGKELGIPVSLVTNGTHLRSVVAELAELVPKKIGVSLDAANAEKHDRLRGVTGAWQQTVDGIGAGLRRLPDAQKRFVVVSTLIPRKRAYLDGLPALLSQLGIREWIVNPLIGLKKNPWSDEQKRQRLADDLYILSDLAGRHDIEITIDDELGLLKSSFVGSEAEQIAQLPIRTIPKGITLSRLVPSGQISVGRDILRPLPPAAPRWQPDVQHPAAFLAAARQRSGNMLCAA